MESDRELLELAAKAAGLSIVAAPVWAGALTLTDGNPWRPLADDGDALRLAVKFRIRLNWGFNHDVVRVDYSSAILLPTLPIYQEVTDGDVFSATRRAIVRAAAEIGKEMK
jgi:hypothetical protein